MSTDSAVSVSAQERLVRQNPSDAAALHNLSVLYAQSGRATEAIDAAQKAVAIDPELGETWLLLGNLRAATGESERALDAYRQATQLDPDDFRGWFNFGNVLALLDRRREAITALERAKTLAPTHSGVLASLALAYRKHGRLDDAIRMYREAEKVAPDNPAIGANLIVTHLYLPSITNEQLFALHRAWNDRHAQQTAANTFAPEPDKKPLRVGYVSGDFRRHPIGFFLGGVLDNHDSTTYVSVCLSDTKQPDGFTERLRASAHEWRETRGLDARLFFETVRRLQIDILVDLSGHFSHSRLSVFAQRAAPVQVTWAGYVGTTGLDAMDWLIADRHHAPVTYEPFASERIARMPDDYVCYTPPDYAPPVGPLPCAGSGKVTFGCFNNLVKVNDGILAVWSKILSAVPGSRLLLKCKDLEQTDLRDRVRTVLGKAGVASERLDLRGTSPHEDLLATYNEVDIALDPFPYSGGLTTLEALWMGVPVITLTGQTFAGRHSTAHLTTVGLDDWITKDERSYVDLAVAKASCIDDLEALRMNLRAQMAQSPVCDTAGFTRALEQQYRDMWRTACHADRST